MGNRSYWVGRGNAEKRRVDKSINDIAEAIKDAYDRASHDIDNQIAAWYQRFADDNGISLALAKKTLDAGELDDFKMTLKEYIKHGEELKSDPSWLEAMKNASTKHHIDRLTALQMTTRAEIQEALAKWTSAAIPKMDGILTESFLRYNFYMQKDMEYGKYINGADIQKLRVAANKPWTPDGIEFKKRIGINNAKLVSTMQRELMQACIIGRPYEEIAENLRNQINLSEYESVRLIRTEATHLATLAERETYNMYDVKEYEYLATLDRRTCDLCGPLDGKVFKVADMVEGVNAPPIHPNCRCTTIPHYDDLGGSRAARDEEGNTIFIDGDTTYDEWKKMQEEALQEIENQGELKPGNISKGIVEGKNLVEEWQKSLEEKGLDYWELTATEAVEMQGFDGLPTLVEEKDFNKAVEESKFIAQRTYGATEKAVVEEYQKMLYNDKWYIDCRIGGAQYGQGMYCASDYTGKLTEGIKAEMEHYKGLAWQRGLENNWKQDRLKYTFEDVLSLIGESTDANGMKVRDAVTKECFDAYQRFRDKLANHTFLSKEDDNLLFFTPAGKYNKQVFDITFDNEYNRIYAKEYAKYLKGESEIDNSITETLTLDPSAKIIEYDEIHAIQETETGAARYIDIGAYAALRGFDAIKATGHGKSGSYTVILNRTKVIFKK